jgi:hypothetical protein
VDFILHRDISDIWLRWIIRRALRVLWWSVVLALPLLVCSAVAQQAKEPEAKVANARWSVQGNEIVIVFELIAPADKTYKISVVLRREGDKSFAVVPKNVSGAIGEGKYAGQREVRWAFRKDVPTGLTGNDFWFEISADEIIETGGAAAVLAGGVIYGIVNASKPASGPAKLPTPPLNRPTD